MFGKGDGKAVGKPKGPLELSLGAAWLESRASLSKNFFCEEVWVVT